MAFELPKSLRQIGQITGSRRVYMEDYVWTYSRQLAKCSKGEERAGVLLGNIYHRKSEKYFLISGMVEIPGFSACESEEFSEELWQKIFSSIKESFTGLQILGWFYTKSDEEAVCSQKLRGIHGKNFPGNDKLMYLYDPEEDEEGLFVNMAGTLEQMTGYYIYYEKNPEMQDYMVKHKPAGIGRVDSILGQQAQGLLSVLPKKDSSKKEDLEEHEHHSGNRYSVAVLLALVLGLGYMAVKFPSSVNEIGDKVVSTFSSRDEDIAVSGSETVVETLAGQVEPVNVQAVSGDDVEIVPQAEETSENPEATPATKAAITATPEVTPIVIGKNYEDYVVKEGDTLLQIAGAYYNDSSKAEDIRQYNHLGKEQAIIVGQKLKLPLN